MDALVKKELEKNMNAINSDLSTIINGETLTDELIKNGFNGIRILVDYCEKLALEGAKAIETI